MEYMSVKEAASAWNLSVRSVQMFCSSGKIPGAKNIGKQWLIPINAFRPSDNRIKKNRSTSSVYHFPFLIFSPSFSYTDDLDLNELDLLDAQTEYIKGNLSESICMCKAILSKKVPSHVKIGAYITISHCSIPLGLHYEYKTALSAAEDICSVETPHTEDYRLLIGALKHHIGWDHSFINYIDVSKLNFSAVPYYIFENLLVSTMINVHESRNAINIYSAVCQDIVLSKIKPLEVNFRFCLSCLYKSFEFSDISNEYARIACDIAVKYHWKALLVKNFSFTPNYIRNNLLPEHADLYHAICDENSRAVHGWQIINKIESGYVPASSLGVRDLSVLCMINFGLSASQICDITGFSHDEFNNLSESFFKEFHVSNLDDLKSFLQAHLSCWMPA